MENSTQYLQQMVTVAIDRPVGSKHPTKGFIYPFNYGFIPDTVSGDGEELDAYVFGVTEPRKTFRGRCIAVIHRIDDNDDKLVIVPDGMNYTDAQIRDLTEPQEKFYKSEIIR